MPALSQVVGDPDLAAHMTYYPEQRYVARPGAPGVSMQVLEELWHGKLWWDMQVSSGLGLVTRRSLNNLLQSCIRPNQCVLYLVLYIDETNVSTIGGVKVWPVYLWIGNLPASIRKQRRGKGGAILIAYLPKACRTFPSQKRYVPDRIA